MGYRDPFTIYGWLGKKADGTPSMLEYAKLKRENEELLRLVGLMTLKLSESQKRSERGNDWKQPRDSTALGCCPFNPLL